MDTKLTVGDIRRQELTAMDEAMGRVERGTYGIFEACGRVIPEKRLRVMLFARYCREDQEKQEGPAYLPGAKFLVPVRYIMRYFRIEKKWALTRCS